MTKPGKQTQLAACEAALREIVGTDDHLAVVCRWVEGAHGQQGLRAFDQLSDRQTRKIINRLVAAGQRLADTVRRLDRTLQEVLSEDDETPKMSELTGLPWLSV